MTTTNELHQQIGRLSAQVESLAKAVDHNENQASDHRAKLYDEVRHIREDVTELKRVVPDIKEQMEVVVPAIDKLKREVPAIEKSVAEVRPVVEDLRNLKAQGSIVLTAAALVGGGLITFVLTYSQNVFHAIMAFFNPPRV